MNKNWYSERELKEALQKQREDDFKSVMFIEVIDNGIIKRYTAYDYLQKLKEGRK